MQMLMKRKKKKKRRLKNATHHFNKKKYISNSHLVTLVLGRIAQQRHGMIHRCSLSHTDTSPMPTAVILACCPFACSSSIPIKALTLPIITIANAAVAALGTGMSCVRTCRDVCPTPSRWTCTLITSGTLEHHDITHTSITILTRTHIVRARPVT